MLMIVFLRRWFVEAFLLPWNVVNNGDTVNSSFMLLSILSVPFLFIPLCIIGILLIGILEVAVVVVNRSVEFILGLFFLLFEYLLGLPEILRTEPKIKLDQPKILMDSTPWSPDMTLHFLRLDRFEYFLLFAGQICQRHNFEQNDRIDLAWKLRYGTFSREFFVLVHCPSLFSVQ